MSDESTNQNVVIYSTPTCTFCQQAKSFFDQNNAQYTEYNVSEDAEKRQEMVDKSGQMGVQVILVGDEVTVGFDEGRLKELLGL